MRASRATELVKEFPEHVVTAWMGHSKRIAQKHYLQVTEEDYKQFSSNPTQQITVSPRRGSQPTICCVEFALVLKHIPADAGLDTALTRYHEAPYLPKPSIINQQKPTSTKSKNTCTQQPFQNRIFSGSSTFLIRHAIQTKPATITITVPSSTSKVYLVKMLEIIFSCS